MEQNLDRAEAIIDAYGCDQSNLIAIMQEIQGEYKYLSCLLYTSPSPRDCS